MKDGSAINQVVVIDDDEGTVEIIAAFLDELPSIRSRIFTSPRVLLDELSTMATIEFPDLVFSDIAMPEYNGLQLVEEVEGICQVRGLTMPRVVFISGNIEDRNRADDILRRIHERGYQTLAKPFCMETILQVTRAAISP